MAVFTVARHEFQRIFSTGRGWIAILALALIWLMILRFVIYPASQWVSSPQTAGLTRLIMDSFGLNVITNWPGAETSLYWFLSLYLLPLFTIMIAADQMASDKARGTLRFITLRTSRSNVFFGKFLGQAVVQFLLIGLTLGSVLLLVLTSSPEKIAAVLAVVPIITINVFIVLLPYIALMSVASVLAKSARQATLYAVIAWIIVSFFLVYIQAKIGPIGLLDWVLPGSQISSLVKLSGWETLQLAPVPIVHTICLLAVGWWVMSRSDL